VGVGVGGWLGLGVVCEGALWLDICNLYDSEV